MAASTSLINVSEDSDSGDSGSDSSVDLATPVHSVVTGYQFEPQRRQRQDRAEEAVAVTRCSRIGNTEWCTCGHCVVMSTEIESLCCREVGQIMAKIEDDSASPCICITEHPGFSQGCLNRYALDIAYLQYRQQYGGLPRDEDANRARRYRYVSYRQLVRWCWGYLGKHNRVPLPSCVVHHVREAYPEAAEGSAYCGFTWPDMDYM